MDAIVHELAVANSDIQSGFRAEEAEDYLYGELENLVPAMREQSTRLREQHQRELKRHVRNEQLGHRTPRRQPPGMFIVLPLWASSNLVDAPRLGVRPC